MLFEDNHVQNGDDCLTVGSGTNNIVFQYDEHLQLMSFAYSIFVLFALGTLFVSVTSDVVVLTRY